MGKIVLYMITTLDGFIADASGAPPYSPTDEEHRFANQLFAKADALLFGRNIYEGFVGYWDTLDLNDPSVPAVEVAFATNFRQTPRIVFSRTLTEVDDKATLIQDNLAIEVTRIKEQTTGYLLLIGGPALVGTLVQLGLVDEVHLLVCPLVLGQGIALFGELNTQLSLQLLESTRFDSGSVFLRYQRA